MPTASPIQTNFSSGEITPRLHGRVDMEQYANGAKTVLNALIQTQGGATKRPGSYYVATRKSATLLTLVRAFRVSTDAAYVIELGNLYARFYRNRGQLLASGSPLELVTPWATAELRELRFAESVDVLYVFHKAHQPRMITRTSASTFQIALAVFENGPYDTQNTGDIGASLTSPIGSTTETGTGSGTVGGSGGGTTPPTSGGGGEFSGEGGVGAGDYDGQGGAP